MATWAIGDVQGCASSLNRLLEKIRYDPAQDQLWFVGDLVSRGPDSEAVLRSVKELGSRAVAVLGNHDLHMLAIAAGLQPNKPSYRLNDLLQAPDLEELIVFVRRLPLVHYDPALNTVLVHAGLYPGWSVSRALTLAGEVESVLQSPQWVGFINQMYGNLPERWDDHLPRPERLRFIINAFTRMRFCAPDLRLDLAQKGSPVDAPRPLKPWFDMEGARNRSCRIIFGHWSDLGIYCQGGVFCIDGGCVWGGQLVAMQLDSETVKIVSTACDR